jgi:hypothetical protein
MRTRSGTRVRALDAVVTKESDVDVAQAKAKAPDAVVVQVQAKTIVTRPPGEVVSQPKAKVLDAVVTKTKSSNAGHIEYGPYRPDGTRSCYGWTKSGARFKSDGYPPRMAPRWSKKDLY